MQTFKHDVSCGNHHRFFLVCLHLRKSPHAPHVSCRATRRGCLDDWYGVTCSPPGADDKEPRSQLFGAANTPHLFAPEQTQRVRVVLVWSRDSGQQKSAALTIYKALMPDLSSLLGIVGGAVLAVYLVQYYKKHYTRSGWLRSGQEASHRLHRA